METEDPRSNNMLERSFLMVKVALDITRPLPTGFWLAREDLPNTWIEFKYERIQDSYCLKCGLLGHGRKDCQRPQAMASWDPSKPRYSAGLGVNKAKPLMYKEAWRTGEETLDSKEGKDEARAINQVEEEGEDLQFSAENGTGGMGSIGKRRGKEGASENQGEGVAQSHRAEEQVGEGSKNQQLEGFVSEKEYLEQLGELGRYFLKLGTRDNRACHAIVSMD
ncbi:hypothetical protein Ahy_B08g093127 [Arachis hypogaea]|uniref:CCHC-type domain-containing protein n=1 Tax=Arachis hypogaea TaxID=3818 RepID=A0A444Y581_ARAHY|nr:hypothetical protein Ahy_B08g093127 [Arachis hypogaea]